MARPPPFRLGRRRCRLPRPLMRGQRRSRNTNRGSVFPVELIGKFELVEVSAILLGEFGLVQGQVRFGEDGILLAQIGAVATVDALVRVDEYLGDGSRL